MGFHNGGHNWSWSLTRVAARRASTVLEFVHDLACNMQGGDETDVLTLTTHFCVENTVLAFMICLLFNLSYKVTITCKWHQLVYFSIITANKPNQPLDFHCISPVRFGNKVQNANFSAKEQHQKLHISIVNF